MNGFSHKTFFSYCVHFLIKWKCVLLRVAIYIAFIFLSLIISNFNPTVYFGLFTALAMIMAVISSLVLLPALLIKLKPLKV